MYKPRIFRARNPAINKPRPKTAFSIIPPNPPCFTMKKDSRLAINNDSQKEEHIKPKTALIFQPAKLSKFIKTSRLYDLIPRPIIVDPMEEGDNTPVDSFIRDFVRDKMANNAARIIQTVWRTYQAKQMWRGLFNHRIWSRRDILMRIFLGWRGYASKKFETQLECYERFEDLQHEKPWLSLKSNLAPFSLFYLSGRYFHPSRFAPRQFMIVVRMFAKPEGRHIFRLWRSLTVSRRAYREKSGAFTFTITKRQGFGFIFFAFVLWHRFTQWKKLACNRNDCFRLAASEFIIDWRVRENILNQKKARQMRADAHSISRIKKKAHNAIYQLFMNRRRFAADMESSSQFYKRRIQETGSKAWLKYIEMQRRKKNEMVKLQRAWYQIAYNETKRDHTYSELTKYRNTVLKSKVVFLWKKSARHEKITSLMFGIKLQQSPAIPYMLLFQLRGHDELSFFIRVWKQWLQYTKRRLLWKIFIHNSYKIDPEYELKQRVLYSIKKLHEPKESKKIKNPVGKFFSNSLPYSFEGMAKYHFKLQEGSINGNMRYSVFLTEVMNKNVDNECMTLLLRSIVLYTNRSKLVKKRINTAASAFDIVQVPSPHRLTFEQIALHFNNISYNLHRQLMVKIRRDLSILFGLSSHKKANELRIYNPNFITTNDGKGMVNNFSFPVPSYLPFTPPETLMSLRHIFQENLDSVFSLDPKYKNSFVKQIGKFHSVCRNPSIVFRNVSNATSDEQRTVSQADISTRSSMKISKTQISPYKKPLVYNTIPFDSPNLSLIRKLDVNKQQALMGRMVSIADFHLNFGIGSMCNKIERIGTLLELSHGLRRFFLSMVDVRIDVSKLIDYKSQNSPINYGPDDLKRLLRRNISAFLANICNFDTKNAVPMFVDAPQWAYHCVSVIMTVHRELKKTNLASYCDSIPFSKKINLDSVEIVSIRNQINSTVIAKFPRFAKKDSSHMPRRSKDSALDQSDEFCVYDIDAATFLLPHILRPDMVGDFLKEEIKIEQNIKSHEHPHDEIL